MYLDSLSKHKKKGKKPNSEGNFQNQVDLFLPAKLAACFGRVLRKRSAWRRLGAAMRSREAQRRGTEARAPRAPGRTFLLPNYTDGSGIPESWGRGGMLGHWGTLRARASVPGRNFSPAPSGAAGPARPAGTFPEPPGTPEGQGSGQRLCAPAAPETPRPGPPTRPDSPRAPAGQEATGRGAARPSPAQEEGCCPRPPQRRWRRPCCPAAAAAPSRNSALPSPPHGSCPPNVGLLGKKVRLPLRNAERGSADPAPRGVSSPCRVRSARQVPARAGARGAGPAQVEARRAAERAPAWLPRPLGHAQSAGGRGSSPRRGGGAGPRGGWPYLSRRGAEGALGGEGGLLTRVPPPL